MTGTSWLMAGGLSEIQQSVRRQFQEGGSGTTVLVILGLLLAVILLAAGLSWRQKRAAGGTDPLDPRKLYRDLLERARLTEGQQRMMRRLQTSLRMRHPAAVLMSEKRFDAGFEAWLATRGGGRGDTRSDAVQAAAIRRVLFPRSDGDL